MAGGDRLAVIDHLPIYDVAETKVAHARAVPPFTVGLFGNSRVIQVGVAALATDAGGAFNFAVPGTGFRQSVALLEVLVSGGRAPRIAVISLDSFWSVTGRTEYPGVVSRVRIAVADTWWLVRHRQWHLAASAVVDDVRTERDGLLGVLSGAALVERLRL